MVVAAIDVRYPDTQCVLPDLIFIRALFDGMLCCTQHAYVIERADCGIVAKRHRQLCLCCRNCQQGSVLALLWPCSFPVFVATHKIIRVRPHNKLLANSTVRSSRIPVPH